MSILATTPWLNNMWLNFRYSFCVLLLVCVNSMLCFVSNYIYMILLHYNVLDVQKGTYSMQSHFDCSVIESGVSSVVSVYDVLHAGETCLAIDRRNCTSGNLFASR